MTHSSCARPWRLSRRQWCLGTLGAITFGGARHKMAGADLPIESGTIIVAAYSQSRIIIAADSKASFRADGFQDEVCKLAYPANKVLYAASGLAGVGEWSAVGEARKAAARIVSDNPYLSESSLNSIAESWARAMAAQIRTLPPRLFARAEAESQTSALFAGLNRSDEIHLMQATVRAVEAAGGRMDARTNVSRIPMPGATTRILAFGMPAIALEFLAGKTPRAQAEVMRWKNDFAGSADIWQEIAIRLVELTIQLEPRQDLVGGAIAAIRMDGTSGVRWLRQPPACLI